MIDPFIQSLADRWVAEQNHAWRSRTWNSADPASIDPLTSDELAELYRWVNSFMATSTQAAFDNGKLYPRGSAIADLAIALGLPDRCEDGQKFLLRFDLIHDADAFKDNGGTK